MNIVTITTFLPLLGAIVLLLYSMVRGGRGTYPGSGADQDQLNNNYRCISLIFTTLTFIASLYIVAGFNNSLAEPQLTQKVSWIAALNANYYVGVDGISIWLVVLTTFLMPISVLASWHIEKRVR